MAFSGFLEGFVWKKSLIFVQILQRFSSSGALFFLLLLEGSGNFFLIYQ